MAPATLRALLIILVSLAAASYYLYSKTTKSSPPRNDDPPSEDVKRSSQHYDFPFDQWPSVRVPGSEHLAAAPPYGPFDDIVEFDPFNPIKRFSLEYGKVACWQDGGVWIKELTPVEMVSLGVDRFQDTNSTSIQAEEDAFCERFRMYGASFWELPPRWHENVVWCGAIDHCADPARRVSLEVGFPTGGGIWFLNTTQGWNGHMRPKRRALKLALTMDERCEVIKDLGGLFCEDPEECPGFKEAQEGEIVPPWTIDW